MRGAVRHSRVGELVYAFADSAIQAWTTEPGAELMLCQFTLSLKWEKRTSCSHM